MNRKPRILCVTEFSELNTGYSTYTKELLSRMHATGKYNIAELACYYHPTNGGWERGLAVPWGLYGNNPSDANQNEVMQFNSDPHNQFGKWRFDRVCLHFRPDFVIDFRDSWMMTFQLDSPFRNFFKLCWMPAVDAFPQDPAWIDKYKEADVIFGYTDWALDILRSQSGGMIRIGGNTSPAANTSNYFKIENKTEHKERFGLPGESFIIGTVMRNQKRKLFDDLFYSFRKILDKLPKEVADRTFLYCHTSYPDVGWNLPRLLQEHNVGNKVLFTYLCRDTGAVYPSLFCGARSVSPFTNQPTANMTNTQVGVDAKILGQIVNCFDAYVQYANMEGLGMPQIEAAACGVPLFSVDYSGMAEAVRKTGGFPVPVQRYVRESETHRYQAYPDNDTFIQLMYDYIMKPSSFHNTKGNEVARLTKENYSWDKTAAVWMNYIDSVVPDDWSKTWESPPNIFQANRNPPPNMNNEFAVCWAIENILGLPQKIHSSWAAQIVDELNYGARTMCGHINVNDLSFLGLKGDVKEFHQQDMMQEMFSERERMNHLERVRCGIVQEEMPDYLLKYKRGEYD